MDVIVAIPAPRQSTYDVAGTTAAELRRQLARHGEWGSYTGGLTVDPQGRPQPTRVRVSSRPVVTMPRWTNRADAPAALQDKWDRMYAALERHERRHDEILRACVEEFRERLRTMTPAPDRNAIRRMGRDLMREHRNRQTRYDRETNHGQREGVDLPD